MGNHDLKVFEGLTALGAGDFAHMDGTLERHLIAVHDLLEVWGADKTLCQAGLYHAAYGTAGFDAAMVSTMQRHRIAALIGPDSEEIVYTYCACARQTVWPRIDGEAKVEFLDRFTDETRIIDCDELRAFCELTCANEVEIANSNPGFAMGDGRHLGRLFARWDRYLSEAASRAVTSAFNL